MNHDKTVEEFTDDELVDVLTHSGDYSAESVDIVRAEQLRRRSSNDVTPIKKTRTFTCRACGREISVNAVSCPHCGEPYKRQSNSLAFNWRDPVHAITAGIAIIVCGLYVTTVLIRWYIDRYGG